MSTDGFVDLVDVHVRHALGGSRDSGRADSVAVRARDLLEQWLWGTDLPRLEPDAGAR